MLILGLSLAVVFTPGCGERGDDAAAGMAHLERGMEAQKAGEPDQAMRDYLAAAELMPDSVGPIIALADLYAVEGQPELAIETYREALAMDPDLDQAHFMIGLISKGALGDLATSMAAFSKAVEIDSTKAVYHFQLGDALQRLGRFNEALERFQRVVEIDPTHSGACYAIAAIYENYKGMPDEAFAWYEKAVAIDPETPRLRELVGMAYARHDRLEDALRHFRECVKIDPESAAGKRAAEAITQIESMGG
jgi:tetratricopeptide (TPR) repeat protein